MLAGGGWGGVQVLQVTCGLEGEVIRQVKRHGYY